MNIKSSIKEAATDAILEKVSLKISGYRGEVTYYDLHIDQTLLNHHTFQFRWLTG